MKNFIFIFMLFCLFFSGCTQSQFYKFLDLSGISPEYYTSSGNKSAKEKVKIPYEFAIIGRGGQMLQISHLDRQYFQFFDLFERKLYMQMSDKTIPLVRNRRFITYTKSSIDVFHKFIDKYNLQGVNIKHISDSVYTLSIKDTSLISNMLIGYTGSYVYAVLKRSVFEKGIKPENDVLCLVKFDSIFLEPRAFYDLSNIKSSVYLFLTEYESKILLTDQSLYSAVLDAITFDVICEKKNSSMLYCGFLYDEKYIVGVDTENNIISVYSAHEENRLLCSKELGSINIATTPSLSLSIPIAMHDKMGLICFASAKGILHVWKYDKSENKIKELWKAKIPRTFG